MSIRVVANNYIREGKEAEFLALAKEMVEKTNALDEGCISYALCRDLADPLHVAMIEEWTTNELLMKHMQAKHFVELIPQMGALTYSDKEVLTIFETVF